MKKLFSTLLIAVAALFVQCNASAQEFVYEPDGIGPVRVGVKVNSLPESIEGLYNSKDLLEEYDEMEEEYIYSLFLKLDNELTVYALYDEAGEIFKVHAYGRNYRTKSGAYDAMPAREFIVLPGIKTVVNPERDYFQVSFQLDGFDIYVDHYQFSAAGQKRYDAAVKSGTVPTFEPSDFEENAFIMINRQY